MAKQPNNLTIGHGGNGTLMHLTAEMFNQMAGTRIELVPYRGIALEPPIWSAGICHSAWSIFHRRCCIEGGLIAPDRRLFGHSISTSPGRFNISPKRAFRVLKRSVGLNRCAGRNAGRRRDRKAQRGL